jgi:hypothetical protein
MNRKQREEMEKEFHREKPERNIDADDSEIDVPGRDLNHELNYIHTGKEKRNFGC